VFSSRIVFASLFIVALIAWLLQRRLDESAEWVAAKKAELESGIKQKSVFSSFGELFRNKTCVRSMLFLAGIYLTWNMVCSVMGFFQPHIYETAGGLSNEMANLMAAGQWVVIIFMTFICSLTVDKVNQRMLYGFGVSCGVLAWIIVIMVGISSMAGLIIFTGLWAMQAGISVQTFYALWASELFPAKYRAAAQGIMFFVVRGVSAVWGLQFVNIYGEHGEGFTLAGVMMMVLFIISLTVGVIWAPKTQGKTLEQITKERYGEEF
jgi:inositol transporter-like SP family MFS transporter